MHDLSRKILLTWIALALLGFTQGCSEEPESTTIDPVTASGPKFGAWLYYLEQTGMSWEQLADTLKDQGVKRIFIKTSEGSNTCEQHPGNLFPETCNTTVPQIFKSRGIEAWAWGYNYPGNVNAQADALYYAAKHGYAGFVLDIEVEFDGKSSELTALMQAFDRARNDAVNDGHATAEFLIGATTWGNPKDHSMRVDIIDQYVDFHMPQTYVEVWGGAWLDDPISAIETGNCEYRELGAKKPIWHIVSAEHDIIRGDQLDDFFRAAGPNASLWRIPGGGVSSDIWRDWDGIDWNRTAFHETRCSEGNYEIPNTEPVAVKAFCPPGAEFDRALGFCADSVDAWGPFPQGMTQACAEAGGSDACTKEWDTQLEGKPFRMQRWARDFVRGLRGDGFCPKGTYNNREIFGDHCVEAFILNGEQNWNVFGPFPAELVERCASQAQGGTACYSMRWSAQLYMGLTGKTAPFPGTEPVPTPDPVAYYSQVDNFRDGTRSCNITSLAMALDHHGITGPQILGERTPDYLLKRFGLEFTPGGLRDIFNTVASERGSAIRDRLSLSATLDDLRFHAERGTPTVVHGWFTPSGHIVVVTGFDGESYTVNDPYGRWNQRWMGSYPTTQSGSGRSVRYAKAAFEDAVSTDTAGNYAPLWLHVFE